MNYDILFNKYLGLLGVKEAPPTFTLLAELVKAHLIKIPFENISKLLYKKQGMNYIPSFDVYLDAIEKHNFGGTCYSNNYYFHLLLKHLGFNVKLCGADMRNPDVHIINIVTTDEKEFIVDGGYAAPFLQPLPRYLETDFIINNGNDKYIVKPQDENGRTRIEHYNDNKLHHWYTANPAPRKIEDFRNVIEDSYADHSTFMNAVRVERFSENGSVSLRNFVVVETAGNKTSTLKISREEMPEVINKKFGMPQNLVKEAVESIKEIKDKYD